MASMLTMKDFGFVLNSTAKNTSPMVESDSTSSSMLTSKVNMRSGPKSFWSRNLNLWWVARIIHLQITHLGLVRK